MCCVVSTCRHVSVYLCVLVCVCVCVCVVVCGCACQGYVHRDKRIVCGRWFPPLILWLPRIPLRPSSTHGNHFNILRGLTGSHWFFFKVIAHYTNLVLKNFYGIKFILNTKYETFWALLMDTEMSIVLMGTRVPFGERAHWRLEAGLSNTQPRLYRWDAGQPSCRS